MATPDSPEEYYIWGSPQLVTAKRCQKRKNRTTGAWETSWVSVKCRVGWLQLLKPFSRWYNKDLIQKALRTNNVTMFWDRKGTEISIAHEELQGLPGPPTYREILLATTPFPETLIDCVLYPLLGDVETEPQYQLYIFRDSITS